MSIKLHCLTEDIPDLVPKLIKENLWSKEYTERVIEEYKKFISMSVFREVAPSREVDVVWHAHLLYTKHYHEMCLELGNGDFIHHNPTSTQDQRTTGKDDYLDTLDYYRRRFKELPPKDIWTKFKDSHYINLDLKQHWVIPVGDWKALIKVLFNFLKSKLWDS